MLLVRVSFLTTPNCTGLTGEQFNRIHINVCYTESITWIDSPYLLEGTVDRVRQVRALGMDVGIDFHGRLHKGMAKQLAKMLELHQPLFIEGKVWILCHYRIYIL